MRVQAKPSLMGGWLTDAGHSLGKAGRSVSGILQSIRGDGGVTTVEGAAPVSYTNMAVYGTLAALAIFIVAKKK